MQQVLADDSLVSCNNLICNTIALKHLFEEYSFPELEKKIKEYFLGAQDFQSLRQICFYLSKSHLEGISTPFVQELKILSQKKQLQEQIARWIGRAQLEATLKILEGYTFLQSDVSWEKFQEVMARAVIYHLLQNSDLSDLELEKWQSCIFEEDYKDVIRMIFSCQRLFSESSFREIHDSLCELFQTIQDPELLQNIIYPLKHVKTSSAKIIDMLIQVSMKKIVLQTSYQYLNLWATSAQNQLDIQKAVHDPQVHSDDFREQLLFLTIEQIFQEKREEPHSFPGTLRSQILSIKNALNLDPLAVETKLLEIANEIQKPHLFLQIAHYLWVKQDQTKHQYILKLLNQAFPIQDISMTEQGHFTAEKGEWQLSPVSQPLYSKSSVNYLSQEIWDLLSTHQIDRAASQMAKSGGIWIQISSLLARREFVAIFDLLQAMPFANAWKDFGIRLFLILGEAQLAAKLFVQPSEIWECLQSSELSSIVQKLRRRGGFPAKVAPWIEQKKYDDVYRYMKTSGNSTFWEKLAEDVFSKVGKKDLATQLSQAHKLDHFSEQKAEKLAQILLSTLRCPYKTHAEKFQILYSIISHMVSWEYDPWKNYLSFLLIHDFEDLSLELARTIKQPSYRESFLNVLLRKNWFFFAWKFLDHEDFELTSLQEHIERSLAKCEDLPTIIQELIQIEQFHPNDPVTQTFCKNVLSRITQSQVNGFSENPEKIQLSLKTLRHILQREQNCTLNRIVCEEWVKFISESNLSELPFYENFIKLFNTIKDVENKWQIYEFCFLKNYRFLIRHLIKHEKQDICKVKACLRLFVEKEVDQALSVLEHIKNMSYYEKTIYEISDILLDWQREGNTELFQQGLEKIMKALQNQQDLIKHRVCLHWIYHQSFPLETLSLMNTITSQECLNQLRQAQKKV